MRIERRAIQASSYVALLVIAPACSSDPDVPTESASSSDDGSSTTGTTDGNPPSDTTANSTTTADATTADATTTDATTADITTTDITTTDATTTDASTSDTDATSSTGDPDPFCGDGQLDPGEACDDAEESITCNADCTLAACGDGLLNASAGELCDDGGESAACNVDCTLAACGDGLLNVMAGELCDDGGESASCNSDCSLAACGDGITNLAAGEDCDDAGASAGCDADCTAAACGDLQLNPLAGEACDGPVLAGATCQSLGYLVGTLACDAGCGYDTTACANLPAPPVLTLGFSAVKQFDFTWAPVDGAEHYELLERTDPAQPYAQLGPDIVGESASFEMPLHLRTQASYVLRACNAVGCSESAAVDVVGSLTTAMGYVKASNPATGDGFGASVALSGDGDTLAIGAPYEDSNATGINGNQASDASSESGAVYVFVRDPLGQWSQQAYVKANNVKQIVQVFNPSDLFGSSVSLSHDGDTLVVGAPYEDGGGTTISSGGSQFDNGSLDSGAVYVFERDPLQQWSQQAYIKAFNNSPSDWFGTSVAVSGDGDTIAVGAYGEDSTGTGINSNQTLGGASASGAVYVYVRNAMQQWSQQAYVKASNTGGNDRFGQGLALSGDGNTLAVGAYWESSNATGINGDQANNLASNAGAVYVYVRNAMQQWSQQAYVKASNTGADDNFGHHLRLSGDGSILVVGAPGEDGSAIGLGGDQASNLAAGSGAAYVLVRDPLGAWAHRAYAKASNSGASDAFGAALALSADGEVLAIGATGEDGNASGIGGNQANEAMSAAGAVYLD